VKINRLGSAEPAGVAIRVDAEGASLGSGCVLVRRTTNGYRCVSREEASAIQYVFLGDMDDPDWLYGQCCRMAKALDDGQLALAQIYGIRIPVRELSEVQTRQLAGVTALVRANFNPDEPRDAHGRWTDEGGATEGRPRLPGVPPSAPAHDVPVTSRNTNIPIAQLAADNRQENKMVRDIVVKLKLTPDQRQKLHRAISGQGLSYQEILDEAREMFDK